ncbi:MAG: AAA family ATPase [Vicinamibacteria bacterium]
MNTPAELRVVQAAKLPPRGLEQPLWLVDGLWGESAVGVIGGAPKSCKTWLALEIAVAVASGRPCLDRFQVSQRGRVLVYAAEDAPEQIRERIEGLARARRANFDILDVQLILEPSLRLDRSEHLARLRQTLARHRPKLLVLDPYVRLQRVDENDATKVSAVLAVLRELSRTFHLAIILVHHTRKNPSEQAGLTLRGSSDFHAWGDSNLYLRRRRGDLLLTSEHRFAPAGPPLELALVTEQSPVRLEMILANAPSDIGSLGERILVSLGARPRRQDELRRELRVRNQHLSDVLRDLQSAGFIDKNNDGWRLVRDP